MSHTTAPNSLEEWGPRTILECIGASVYPTVPFPTSMWGNVQELHYLPAAWEQSLQPSHGLVVDGPPDRHLISRNAQVFLKNQGVQAQSGQSRSFQTPVRGIADSSLECREVLYEGNIAFAEPTPLGPLVTPHGQPDPAERFSFLSLQQTQPTTFEPTPALNPDFSLYALYKSNSNPAPLGSPQAYNGRKSEMKPRCFEHGCGGRSFSSIHNLIRHQRENDIRVVKPACFQCGRKFTRKNARDKHFNEKCRYRNRCNTGINYQERISLQPQCAEPRTAHERQMVGAIQPVLFPWI